LASGSGVGDDCFTVVDGDVLASEGLELGGQIAGAAIFVDPGFVVSGPEIAESGVGVGEQMVDDGEYRVAGGDDRLLLAAASGQAPIAGAQEGVGARMRSHDAAQSAGQPGIALAAALAHGTWWLWGQNLADDTRWAAEGNRVMSTPVSAMSSPKPGGKPMSEVTG